MKARPLSVSMVLGMIVLVGCGGMGGKTVPREAQQGPEFRPRKVYALEMRQAWDVTLKALKREGIPLETANRDIWIIRTDYQNLSSWERKKCDIRFSREPQRNTYIFVHCQYEGRKNASEPFRDFTYSAPRKAMKAEEEIYRKLEPHLLSFERTSSPLEEVSAKPAVPYGAAQVTPKPAPKAETAMPGPSPAAVGSLAAVEGKSKTVSPPPPAAAENPRHEGGAAPPPESKEGSAARASTVPPKKSEIKEETLSAPLMTVAPTNVRVGPSTQTKISTVLNKGERIEKTGESGRWTRIKLSSGEDGWVFTDLLQPATTSKPTSAPLPPEVQASLQPKIGQVGQTRAAKEEKPARREVEGPAKTFFITLEITKMWAEPDPKSKVVLVLKKGRRVEKLAESGEFIKVRLSWGTSGWVLKRFLQPAP